MKPSARQSEDHRRSRLQALLREPMLHFLVLGALLFGAYGILAPDASEEPDRIVITRGDIDALAKGFTRAWQRPPTEDELKGLIDDRIREEVYVREALKLGLDRDDTVVRRRLRQKLEFIAHDLAAQAKPADAELEAFLAANAERFRVKPSFTFEHVYLDPARRGEGLERDAEAMAAQLNAGAVSAADQGDPFLLATSFVAEPEGQVVNQFGPEFAASLEKLPPGRWMGPIKSGLGFHLVLLHRREEARLPPLSEIREAVERVWANERREAENEKYYRALLGNYEVSIEAKP